MYSKRDALAVAVLLLEAAEPDIPHDPINPDRRVQQFGRQAGESFLPVL
jgi:hypothetical protein